MSSRWLLFPSGFTSLVVLSAWSSWRRRLIRGRIPRETTGHKQGSWWITNPNNALLRGNPSKLPMTPDKLGSLAFQSLVTFLAWVKRDWIITNIWSVKRQKSNMTPLESSCLKLAWTYPFFFQPSPTTTTTSTSSTTTTTTLNNSEILSLHLPKKRGRETPMEKQKKHTKIPPPKLPERQQPKLQDLDDRSPGGMRMGYP